MCPSSIRRRTSRSARSSRLWIPTNTASRSPTISSDRDPLAPHFAAWRAAGRTALIPYLTAGYPSPAATDDLLDALVRGGADIIELGVPFSDPVADGPTIQRASQCALDQGMTLHVTLDILRRFRARHDTPVILFSYLNPIMRYDVDAFLRDAAAAGAQGVLLTDLPVGADPEMESRFTESPLALIRLVAPTTSPERIAAIGRTAQGFIYYIARLGVTGAGGTMREELGDELAAMRRLTAAPIAVGFGVSTAAHAAALAGKADGVIVGSALIDAIDRGGASAAEELLLSMSAVLG
ncbi:MAG: tryptophan synthase subunit alpha [Longimicrobiales bacterium]